MGKWVLVPIYFLSPIRYGGFQRMTKSEHPAQAKSLWSRKPWIVLIILCWPMTMPASAGK